MLKSIYLVKKPRTGSYIILSFLFASAITSAIGATLPFISPKLVLFLFPFTLRFLKILLGLGQASRACLHRLLPLALFSSLIAVLVTLY